MVMCTYMDSYKAFLIWVAVLIAALIIITFSDSIPWV